MHAKVDLKITAIKLRRQGKTYSEILKIIPVAKSTLSLWFHEVKLAHYQIQRITQKRIDGQKKGAKARRDQRILSQKTIWKASENEIGQISKRELWLVGIALYWAEGSKEKVHKTYVQSPVAFTNMDPRMIQIFIKWLLFCGISKDRMIFSLFIHESRRDIVGKSITFWAKVVGVSESHFTRIYFKKERTKTNRKNTGDTYHGVLRISVRNSSTYMRKIQGWTNGLFEGINKGIAGSSNGRTPPFGGA